MFTGLIADLGVLKALERDEQGATLTVLTRLAGELSHGDSIAVNGVCLTAVEIEGETFKAQAIEETLRRSTLGSLEVSQEINLELALRAGDRLGGHIVQGHVDGVGTIGEVRREGFGEVLRVDIEPKLSRYLVHKGSVAVDGVSLTVSKVGERGFEVSLIPETLERTNLSRHGAGGRVNIEVDILAKHVERLMEARS